MTQAQTVRELVLAAEQRLEDAGVHFGHGTDNALDEAAWLVASTLHIDPADLDDHLEDVPDAAQQRAIEDIINRRITTRQPAAYLLHEAWFAGLKFYVDERVIVPRSLIGALILDHLSPWVDPGAVHRILDLCTGSGCIGIALAATFPEAQVDATDISREALAVAEKNVALHSMQGRVRLIESDLFAGLAGERYDLIVTNPPYVSQRSMDNLPAEYRHEPALALASGEQGIDDIIHILTGASAHLTPHGILIAEVGDSGPALQARFPHVPFMWLSSDSGDEQVFMLTAQELTGFGFHHESAD